MCPWLAKRTDTTERKRKSFVDTNLSGGRNVIGTKQLSLISY
jgi:hypothetical protein